jgi:hypothetical protein
MVHHQELVGLHGLPVLVAEVGEHQARVVLAAEKLDGGQGGGSVL